MYFKKMSHTRYLKKTILPKKELKTKFLFEEFGSNYFLSLIYTYETLF